MIHFQNNGDKQRAFLSSYSIRRGPAKLLLLVSETCELELNDGIYTSSMAFLGSYQLPIYLQWESLNLLTDLGSKYLDNMIDSVLTCHLELVVYRSWLFRMKQRALNQCY